MRLEISEALRRTVRESGPDAQRWLDDLPALLTHAADAWNLALDAPFEHPGVTSLIVPVTTADETAAILKLSLPSPESRHEGTALRCWDGAGAVRLLRSSDDGFTLLLERLRPGHDLWSLPVDEQLDVIVDLLPRLWASPPADHPFRELAGTTLQWQQQMHHKARAMGIPRGVADRAQGWAQQLRTSQPRRLLHGDFNPGNVLATAHHGWKAIDPKPWVGDPAFDLAQVLANWTLAETSQDRSARVVHRRALGLADRLALDPQRVLRWSVVKAIGWNLGRDGTLLLDAAARAQ